MDKQEVKRPNHFIQHRYRYLSAMVWGYIFNQWGLFDVPYDFVTQETKHYKAADYTDDASKVDTSVITVKDKKFNTHIFEGFTGLSQDEADNIVNSYNHRIQYVYNHALDMYYEQTDYNSFVDNITIPNLALELSSEEEHSAEFIENYTSFVASYLGDRLDPHSEAYIATPNDLSEQKMIESIMLAQKIIKKHKDIDRMWDDAARQKKFQSNHSKYNTKYNKQENVNFSVLDKRFILIEIPNFTDEDALGSIRQNLQKATEIYGQQLEGIVIDLRDNPGGYERLTTELVDAFTNATDLGHNEVTATMWLDHLYLLLNGKPNARYLKTPIKGHVGQTTDLPINILINNQSASAAEVFAGTLQGLERAKVFGKTPSFGKGLGQATYNFKELNAKVKITIQALYLPKIGSYQAIGISPDVLVDMTPRDTKYPYFYERDYRGHIPNPEGKTEAPPSPYRCKVDFDYAKGDKQAWYKRHDMMSDAIKAVNIGYDETMLCALDDLMGTPQYSVTEANKPKAPQV
ncbi:MAG: S41 family peptidase [Pseudomonadota bacterium]|nr:S41 family peptidase [Pseudomonadota bacterium]